MEIGANSSLFVLKVNASDAGNYTCSIGQGETLQQYSVLLHITNGTSLWKLCFLAEIEIEVDCKKNFGVF